MAQRITPTDLKKAHEVFEANESRDIFYRAATELVNLALLGKTSLTVAEALAVLLQTWNKAYYQYRKFDNDHFASIERLLELHHTALKRYRNRSITDLVSKEQDTITQVFQAFERVLGPVGAAKALHLLAPRLFPLWDRAIAQAYGLPLSRAGSNGYGYWCYMLISKRQCMDVIRDIPRCQSPLKLIDEYNYCRYTKDWL